MGALRSIGSGRGRGRGRGFRPEADRIRKVAKGLEEELARAARPKTAARKIGNYTFSGGEGTSIEDAIVIGGAEDSAGAVDAKGVWIRANHPGFKKGDQALLSMGGKHYDEITIEGPDGKKKVVYFDITSCFGFPGLDE